MSGNRIDWEHIAWEHNFKGNADEMLRYYHQVKRMSLNQIAKLINVSHSAISKFMKKKNIAIYKTHNPLASYSPRLPGNK